MSKKTENIYRSISRLEDLRQEVSVLARLLASDAFDSGEEGRKEEIRHLENIEFGMGQEIKSLKFWIGSLYLYNGKSTSRAKQAASKENGKKGGRPPREITAARRRIREIEEDEIPLLEHRRNMAVDLEEDSRLGREIEGAEKEIESLRGKIREWEAGRAGRE